MNHFPYSNFAITINVAYLHNPNTGIISACFGCFCLLH